MGITASRQLQGAAEHFLRGLVSPVAEVRKLGGKQIGASGVARQSLGGSPLAVALKVDRSRIEIVDSVAYGIVHQRVDLLLVNLLLAVLGLVGRPAHTAVSEKRNALVVTRHLSLLGIRRALGRRGAIGRIVACSKSNGSGGRGRTDFNEFSSIHTLPLMSQVYLYEMRGHRP